MKPSHCNAAAVLQCFGNLLLKKKAAHTKKLAFILRNTSHLYLKCLLSPLQEFGSDQIFLKSQRINICHFLATLSKDLEIYVGQQPHYWNKGAI